MNTEALPQTLPDTVGWLETDRSLTDRGPSLLSPDKQTSRPPPVFRVRGGPLVSSILHLDTCSSMSVQIIQLVSPMAYFEILATKKQRQRTLDYLFILECL